MTLRPGGLLIGLALASPSLWDAVAAGTLDPDVALQRTLVALVVCSVAWGVLASLWEAYARAAADAADPPREPLPELAPRERRRPAPPSTP